MGEWVLRLAVSHVSRIELPVEGVDVVVVVGQLPTAVWGGIVGHGGCDGRSFCFEASPSEGGAQIGRCLFVDLGWNASCPARRDGALVGGLVLRAEGYWVLVRRRRVSACGLRRLSK